MKDMFLQTETVSCGDVIGLSAGARFMRGWAELVEYRNHNDLKHLAIPIPP